MAITGFKLNDNAKTIAMQQQVQGSNIQRPAFGSLSPTATKNLALKSYGQDTSTKTGVSDEGLQLSYESDITTNMPDAPTQLAQYSLAARTAKSDGTLPTTPGFIARARQQVTGSRVADESSFQLPAGTGELAGEEEIANALAAA